MWSKNVTIAGSRVVLRPLGAADGPALAKAAADGELWNLKVTRIPRGDTVDDYIGHALAGRAAGTVMAFATMARGAPELALARGAPELALARGEQEVIVGSTRFWQMDRANRSVEIGHTWIAESWQRSYVNTEAKYLMLRFAFEDLGCIRVQFQTDVLNTRSQAAILRLGAQCEGVARRERIMPDGRKRDTMRFSIIDDDWPEVRRNLEARLGAHKVYETT